MNNKTILFGFFILIFIIYLISLKKDKDENYVDMMNTIQDRQIEELKNKLKDK